MIFSLIVVVLLLAIAFFQSTQGLFSALIMAVFSVCCAAAAVGCYEYVAVNFLAPYWKPDLSFGISLAVLFGVPLVIFRITTDKLVRRSCHVQSLFDRLGGALCGLITGYTVMGVATLALQNLPLGGSLFGFERVNRVPTARSEPDAQPPEEGAPERNLWMSPDRFVAGLGAVLSEGVFSGERSFVADHPDHIQHLGWVHSTPPAVSNFAPPNSMSVVRTEPIKILFNAKYGGRNTPTVYEETAGVPEVGHALHLVRLALTNGARGANPSHYFSLRQVRIVGKDKDTGRIQQFHPVAIQQRDETEIINRHIRHIKSRNIDWPVVDDLVVPREDNNGEIEFVFELPTTFDATFIEYKHGARARIKLTEPGTDTASGKGTENSQLASGSGDSGGGQETPAPPGRRSRRRRSGSDSETVGDSGRGGRSRGLSTIRDSSFFGADLPLELKDYRDLNSLEVRRGKMRNGHLVADVAKQESGSSSTVRTFAVDTDKRLLHLNMKRLHAKSGLGKAVDLASRTVQSYTVEDSSGTQYKIVGKYAIADIDGTETLEIQYFPEQAGTIGGLGKFKRIQDRHLEENYELVLLFLVDPGVTVTAFSAGGSAQRRDDLTGENLVAPK